MSELEERVLRLRGELRRARGAPEGDVRTVVSPYRVCPIGAHVDHQHGPVLGMAISAYTVLAFVPAASGECVLTSANFEGEVRFAVAAPARSRDWGVYARGAAWALRERLPERPRGVFGRVEGSLPGGGLSSSASVLLAYLTALAAANDVALGPHELVELSRRAENRFVGVASGILDPASIVGARRGRLVAIDTERAAWESVPLGAGAPAHRILVAFTGTTRNLVGTEFNRRVAECREAARRLGELAGRAGARLLGDLPESAFDAHLDELSPTLRGRARHFADERARVREGEQCWRRGDLERFGQLMNESCRSSIAHYETGSTELVRLQDILESTRGVLGARFSGAGYGGCSVALVAAEEAETCRDAARRAFTATFPELADRTRFALVDGEDGVRLA